jgi:methylglyoxal synthase
MVFRQQVLLPAAGRLLARKQSRSHFSKDRISDSDDFAGVVEQSQIVTRQQYPAQLAIHRVGDGPFGGDSPLGST